MNNPPAFPNDGLTCASEHTGGMTLLDYFAAKAMPLIIESYAGGEAEYAPQVAEISYAFAKAMLAEREKAQP